MALRNRLFLLCLIAMMMLAVMPVVAQDKIQIPMWIAFTDNRLIWAQEKAAAFNEAFPQYEVTVEGYANYEEILDATVLALEQGTAPAIVQWFEVGTQFARDSGYFKPIAAALGDRTEVNGIAVNFDDIIAPVSSYYTIDGQFTSMPWNSSSPILYANQEMLETAGVEVPTTWQELEAACAAILGSTEDLAGCITWPNHGWFFEQWLAQQNQELANNGNGRDERATEINLTSEAAVDIATWWQSMYNQGYYVYTGVQRDWDGSQQTFQSAQVPFLITSSADARNVTNAAADNGITVVTGRMPYDEEDGWTGNLIGGASLWLVDGLAPEVEEGALTFLAWFTNTENAAEWHQVTGYLPVRTSSVDLLDEQGWFEENPNFRTASEQIGETTVTPATRGALLGTFAETRNLVTQAIEDLMLLGGDPAERLATAQAEANTLLEEYNLLYSTE
jgi:sn-glycerol 3-phosphate transport system substrate-binding protein